MHKLHKISILTLILSLTSLFFSISAYNATDLLRELSNGVSSPTKVLYRGVLSGSEQYSLLQEAIDQGYLKNKKLLIKFKSEFTNNSLKSFARIYAGVPLSISGNNLVNEETWEESIKQIRNGYKPVRKTLPKTTEQIQQELVRLLERNKLSDQKRINELMGLLGEDPYANSYTGSNSTSFDNMLNGELIGIGVSIEKTNNGNIMIGHVYEGPAKSAGLQSGDMLIRIDDLIVNKTTTLTEAGEFIQGKENTTVIIVVVRNDKVYEYTITRKKVTIDPIIIEQIKPDTTLMSISMFQTNAYDSFLKKLPIIKKSKNLIIDLRNNLGGDLDKTQKMLNHFIPQGQPLFHIESNNITTTTYSKGSLPLIKPETSIYFMTNHDTASASEIFAGVIHEYYPTSKIIGTQTYGKGTVQTVRANDHETVKFTTGRWLLGKTKSSIDGIGIHPDIILSDDLRTPQDEVLQYILKQI